MEELTKFIKCNIYLRKLNEGNFLLYLHLYDKHPIRPISLTVEMVETYMEIAKEDLEEILEDSNVTLSKGQYDKWVRDYTIELSKEGVGRMLSRDKTDIDYETLLKESIENKDILRKQIVIRPNKDE